MSKIEEDRRAGTLAGLALGDALAMPVHWFYDTKNIGSIDGLRAPSRFHSESMISGMSYDGSIDILHDKAVYYEGGQHVAKDDASLRDKHGNFVGKREADRVHYHASLRRGQNTVTACLARLLVRYLVEEQERGSYYDPFEYLERMKTYFCTPSKDDDEGQVTSHNDIYLDIWVRRFFAAASRGVPLSLCAANQRDVWSIGSLDGVVMAIPVIVAYSATESEAGLIARAIEHAALTHKSLTVNSGIAVLAPLLQGLIQGKSYVELLEAAMAKLKPPKITGKEMLASYRGAGGPGNIAKKEKFQQHMVSDSGTVLDVVKAFPDEIPLEDVVGFVNGAARFSTACYVEHALPIVLYLAWRYHDKDPKLPLQANAALGGHSTARGAVLGAILGAHCGLQGLPRDWLNDLADPDQVIHHEASALAAATPPLA